MLTVKQIIFASVIVFALLTTAAAQDNPSTTARSSSLTITASSAGERVRITAPSSVVQMRVEVYAVSGEKLFDQEIRGGNVFDWHLQDGQAQRLAPGDYVCVVTAKSISGKLTQKIGAVNVEEKSVSVQPAESQQLSAPQAQTIGPVEENSSWTTPGKDEPQTTTVIAHDGTDGQMIRGRGALTFRIGNFFSGIDTEQMRLTEDGRLGIGTSNPQATLDVAGTIRAQRFLIAKPNTSAGDIKAQAPDAADSVQPLIAGTGTLNRIAKWTDNVGTLGDSGITETGGGLVGIGTTSPNAKLTVNANAGIPPTAPLGVIADFVNADENNTFMTADSYGNANIHSDFLFRRARGTMAAPTAVQANDIIGQIQARGYGATGFAATARSSIRLAAAENWTNSAQGAYLSFFTTPNLSTTIAERMRIDNAGNVGIGTSTPFAKLEVISTSLTGVQGWGSHAGVWGLSSLGDGVRGYTYAATGAGVNAAGHSSSGTALQIQVGGIQVNGAGVNTSTTVFTQRATVANISSNTTFINNPLTNGNPNAILIITPNFNPGGGSGIYNLNVVGVYYESFNASWGIFNLNQANMPVGAAFNVLVVKP